MQGWWSYEVCCLSHINQFHAEKDQLQAAHSLGQSAWTTTQGRPLCHPCTSLICQKLVSLLAWSAFLSLLALRMVCAHLFSGV